MPEKIILTGAGVHVAGLKDSLAALSGLPCEEVDALSVLKKRPAPMPAENDLAALSLASILGIVLAPEHLEVNLIPVSVRLRRGLERKARALSAMGVFLMTASIAPR